MAKKKRDKRDIAFVGAMGRALAVEGMNKANLADKINTSRTTLYNWHNNPSIITLGHFRIVARELHLTDDEIVSIIK